MELPRELWEPAELPLLLDFCEPLELGFREDDPLARLLALEVLLLWTELVDEALRPLLEDLARDCELLLLTAKEEPLLREESELWVELLGELGELPRLLDLREPLDVPLLALEVLLLWPELAEEGFGPLLEDPFPDEPEDRPWLLPDESSEWLDARELLALELADGCAELEEPFDESLR